MIYLGFGVLGLSSGFGRVYGVPYVAFGGHNKCSYLNHRLSSRHSIHELRTASKGIIHTGIGTLIGDHKLLTLESH